MEDPVQETKLCDNCKKEVSVANFLMHNVHCQRNIILCGKCREPFPKNEMAEHMTAAHTKFSCLKCGKEIEQLETEVHNAEHCSKRLINCDFCGMDVIANGLAEHVDYCGSRTERCEECGQYVMVKYQAIHLQSNHAFLTLDEVDKQKTSATKYSAPVYSSKVNYNGIGFDKDVLGRRSNPGKRNNDMPQINVSDSAQKAKETAKPTLQALRSTPHGTGSAGHQPPLAMPSEQLDHLIAMQMSDEDRTSAFSDSDTENDWRETRPAVPRFPPSEDFDDLSLSGVVGGMWAPLLSAGRERRSAGGGGYPGMFETTALRPFSLDRRASPAPEEDFMSLPCEFCNELFPEDVLLAHQTCCDRNGLGTEPLGFSADLTTDRQFPFSGELNNVRSVGNQHREASPIVNNLTKSTNFEPRMAPTNDDDQVMIPCEYCNELFESDYIIQHESGCELSAEHALTPEPSSAAVTPEEPNMRAATPSPPRRPPRSPPRSLKHQPDPDITYLENLFLKEAIQNSLKDGGGHDKNSAMSPPTSFPSVRQLPTVTRDIAPLPCYSPPRSGAATKVRQVPIKVDPNYDQRSRTASSKVDEKENVAALFKVRNAKAAYAGGAPTCGNVYPPIGYDRDESEAVRNSSVVSPAYRRENGAAFESTPPRKSDQTGARPKSYGGKSLERTYSDEDNLEGSPDGARSHQSMGRIGPAKGGLSARRRQEKPKEEPLYLMQDPEDSVRPVPPRRPRHKQNQ